MDGDDKREEAGVVKGDVSDGTEPLPTALLAFRKGDKDGDMQDGALAPPCSAVAFL